MKKQKELFHQICELLQGKADPHGETPEVKEVIDRISRISVVEEPAYDEIWKKVGKRTVARLHRRRLMLFRTAAVLLPACLCISAIYLFQAKTEKSIARAKIEKQDLPVQQVRLTLSDGKTITLPKDTVGEVLKTAQIAIRQESPATISYQVSDPGKQELQYHLLEVPAEADYRLTLADGTVVYLNSSSRLRYPVVFAGNERRVYLEGEGYFEVRTDRTHPFRVEVNGTVVEAVGTVFNINAYPEKEGVEATLVSGKVNVVQGQQQVALLPGQQAHCGKEAIRVREVDCREFISWKNGMFIFNRMPLEHIMMQMQRWYGLNVFFSQEKLKDYTFTGMIDKHLSAGEIFKTIAKTIDVHFHQKGNTVVIE